MWDRHDNATVRVGQLACGSVLGVNSIYTAFLMSPSLHTVYDVIRASSIPNVLATLCHIQNGIFSSPSIPNVFVTSATFQIEYPMFIELRTLRYKPLRSLHVRSDAERSHST